MSVFEEQFGGRSGSSKEALRSGARKLARLRVFRVLLE